MPGWYEFWWFAAGVTVGAVVTQGIRWVDWIRLRHLPKENPSVDVVYVKGSDNKRLH